MDNKLCLAIFGQTEKGSLGSVYAIDNLTELFNKLGCATIDSKAIFYAIEAIYYDRKVLFVPVKEEGSNLEEYREGIKKLKQHSVDAIFVPGVGNASLLSFATSTLKAVVFMTGEDTYDYLTSLYSETK